MMNMSCPRIYVSTLSVIALFTPASCIKSRESHGNTASVTNTAVVSVVRPSLAFEGKAAGEVQPFKPVGEDLEASLSAHPAPDVWLTFPAAAGQTRSQSTPPGEDESTAIRVALPPEAGAVLSALWKLSLISHYRLQIDGARDGVSSRNMMVTHMNATTRAQVELEKMQIDAPDGRRAISPDEAGELVKFINVSARAIIEEVKQDRERRRRAA
ncbi:MAG TPA: hypothetical protein VF588_14085 [Pyrinomonadaceae bacterium]